MCEKTGMLVDEMVIQIHLAVLTQNMIVTDGWTDRQKKRETTTAHTAYNVCIVHAMSVVV